MKITAIIILLLTSALVLSNRSSSAGNVFSAADSAKICIVSGESIEGEGVKYRYLDKEITFCCGGCEKKLKKEPADYLKGGLKCPVCDEDDANRELFSVVNGVKYYFCGDGCKKKFDLEPDMYFNQYNK